MPTKAAVHRNMELFSRSRRILNWSKWYAVMFMK